MTEHFTKNTVAASFYCSRCEMFTMHRIDGGRKGPCLNCIGKLEEKRPGTEPPPQQGDLFR